MFARDPELTSGNRKIDLKLTAEGKSDERSITIQVVPSELVNKIFVLVIRQLQPNSRLNQPDDQRKEHSLTKSFVTLNRQFKENSKPTPKKKKSNDERMFTLPKEI